MRSEWSDNPLASTPLPLVSVVMPIRNEESAIRHSVACVLAQDYPAEAMEIVVVDGMSTDNTRAILAEMQAQDGRIRILDNPGRIMPKGFNTGVRHARGEVIVMLGGHAEMGPRYISTCVRLLREGVAEAVGGVLDTVSSGDGGDAVAAALASRFGVGNVAFRTATGEHRYVDTVVFGAYRRDIFLKAGMLDEEFVRNNDDEFNYRLRKYGVRLLLVPEISCRYRSRSSIGKLWSQYFQYGLWKVRVMQKHPWQMQWRHFVPALFVSALALSLAGSWFLPLARWSFLALAGLYLIGNLTASVLVAARARSWRLLVALPAAFAALHFAYGSGFLLGLIRFWNRWQRDDAPRGVEWEAAEK